MQPTCLHLKCEILDRRSSQVLFIYLTDHIEFPCLRNAVGVTNIER